MATEPVTPAGLRAAAEEELAGPGAQRLDLLRQLEELDTTIRPLVLKAMAMEVPQRRISALTGISRTTIIAWQKGAGSTERS